MGNVLLGQQRMLGMGLLPLHNIEWPRGLCGRSEKGKSWHLRIILKWRGQTWVILFIKNARSGYWKVGFVFPLKILHRRGHSKGRAKKISFHACNKSVCSFYSSPHHHQIIYTNFHIASDCSQIPGCYFGSLAARLVAFLQSYCLHRHQSKEESKALGYTEAKLISHLREVDLPLHSTGSGSPGSVRLCTPKTPFDSCCASAVPTKPKILPVKNFYGNTLPS